MAGQRGRSDYLHDNSSNNEIHDAIPAAGTHDDQIRVQLFGNLYESLFRPTVVQQVVHFNIICM